jgi:hypothetical protein
LLSEKIISEDPPQSGGLPFAESPLSSLSSYLFFSFKKLN